MKLREWNARLHGLVVFRSLLDDPVVAKLLDLTDRMEAGAPGYGPVCDAVAQFEAALFEHTTNWGSYLSAAVLEAETVCVRQAASGTLAPALQTALDSELAFLQALCGLTLDELLAAAGSATGQAQELAFLPRWETSGIDLPAAYAQRMSEVGKKGYGMFAKHHVFTVENGQLVPVKYPDPQRLSELPGYEKEREKVIANTKALLAGMPANNVLLYGDAGTGKSSAVKAIANEFAPEGLRLVEVKKNQLYQIPDLMDKLAANPLKFILFIDDLSFTANDDNFAALKAILEGSVGGRARNIAVYATSNRRHLIKETLTDRTGDDIHEADTRQELMSLSARFGLTVTFQRPEKARFETILEELAKQHHVDMPMDQLLVKAEAFAIRAGGRSPRVAKQFIEQCESGVQK
jgi:predicted AAA+ superfamily ATPase